MLKVTPTFSHFPFSILQLVILFLCVTSQAADLEETVLLRLKQFWSNPPSINWTLSSNSTPTHCDWPDIICTGGSITGLNLHNKNITGPIPPFICDLQNLTTIDLGNNYISGLFPTILYNCSKLKVLDLSQNLFVGPIPDDIDRLSVQLQSLDLSANNFSDDIPATIGRFPELRILRLMQNEFHGGSFPPEIGNLSNLEWLELSDNDFKPMEIPPSFTQLKKVKKLWIKNSNLVGEIPDKIRNLTKLEFLDLSSNKLRANIPNGLFQLKNLKIVFLYLNRLSGEIPKSIEAWSLEVIDLSDNNLTGTIPDDFGRLMNLSYLSLFYNQFSGEVPESIGRLPSLRYLRLLGNSFIGHLPPDLGRYSKLWVLQVQMNHFTDKLPEHLCANGALIEVHAHQNNLSGELPNSLGNCNSLVIVQVNDNQLFGDVPAGLWTSPNMMSLMLSNNYFTGQLPDRLASNLSRIEINDNNFSGKIPIEVSSWKNLMVLKASNNFFNGTIPRELTTLPILTTLLLDGNRFSGQFPENIVSWNWLTILNLSRNQLSGRIPSQIGYLPRLTELDLSRNDFSGEIPSQIGMLRLTFLNLSSNCLTGRIPHKFDNEAFKTSFLNNSGLCGNNPLSVVCYSKSKNESKIHSWLITIVSLAAFASVSSLLFKFFHIRAQKGKLRSNSKWEFTQFQSLEYNELDIVTSLTENNVIGTGGSGKVYRASFSRSGEAIAVKQIQNFKKSDENLQKEFQAEVEILGRIRHRNIVKLLCCFSSDATKLLVYEHLENQSLDRWLHAKNMPGFSDLGHRMVLDWPKRMKIAVGAARGLCYMHHDVSPSIIHRDVKSSNILLDSDFNPKIADFGLAKILLTQGQPNAMSTVAGTIGYIAPEYARTGRADEKIDVYSFGVVLLELATGREAVQEDEEMCLADWAWRHIQEGKTVVDALDEKVKEACYLEEMTCVFKLGIFCTSILASNRPCMKKVAGVLTRYWR